MMKRQKKRICDKREQKRTGPFYDKVVHDDIKTVHIEKSIEHLKEVLKQRGLLRTRMEQESLEHLINGFRSVFNDTDFLRAVEEVTYFLEKRKDIRSSTFINLLRVLRNESERKFENGLASLSYIHELPEKDGWLSELLEAVLKFQRRNGLGLFYASSFLAELKKFGNEFAAAQTVTQMLKTSDMEEVEKAYDIISALDSDRHKYIGDVLSVFRDIPFSIDNLKKLIRVSETLPGIYDCISFMDLMRMAKDKQKMLDLIYDKAYIGPSLKMVYFDNPGIPPEDILERFIDSGKEFLLINSVTQFEKAIEAHPDVLDRETIKRIRQALEVVRESQVGRLMLLCKRHGEVIKRYKRIPLPWFLVLNRYGVMNEDLTLLDNLLSKRNLTNYSLIKEYMFIMKAILKTNKHLFFDIMSMKGKDITFLERVGVLSLYGVKINRQTLKSSRFDEYIAKHVLELFVKVFRLNNSERSKFYKQKERWLDRNTVVAFLLLNHSFDQDLRVYWRKVVKEVVNGRFDEWKVKHKNSAEVRKVLGKYGFKVWNEGWNEETVYLEAEKRRAVTNMMKGVVTVLIQEQSERVREFVRACLEGDYKKITRMIERGKLKNHLDRIVYEELTEVWKRMQRRIIHIPTQIRIVTLTDPLEIIHIGVKPVFTCQNWKVPTSLSQGIFSYIADNNKRIIAVKNSAGTILFRVVVRLETYNNESPLLIIEPVYGESRFLHLSKYLAEYIIKFAMKLKRAWGRNVYIATGSIHPPSGSKWINRELELLAKKYGLEHSNVEVLKTVGLETLTNADYSDTVLENVQSRKKEIGLYDVLLVKV
ncbi:hypothetical protein J7K41_04425 [Candidatus Micrarchaeota archaeon]|nr:hypothetical protein [Candidatus Micrarchaeota archaeon]